MTLKIISSIAHASGTSRPIDPLDALEQKEAHLNELAWRGIISYAKLRHTKILLRTRYQLAESAKAHPSQSDGIYFD
ncbi:hypothetical protein ACHAQA_006765 [Verticillium albo-atrum]